MRVRLFQLRLIAAFLLLLWIVALVAIVVLYHPGGPVDGLVAAALLGPVFVAAVGLRWPPLAFGDHAAVVMGWLGILACLLLIPVLVGVLQALAEPVQASLAVPSPEGMYAGTATLFMTCLFGGLGLARPLAGPRADRQRRFIVGGAAAMGLTLLTGGLLGGAILVNGLALEANAPPSSAYGPVGTATPPPTCEDDLAAGPYATVTVAASASVDGRTRATSRLTGTRAGSDEAWQATGTRDGLTSSRGYRRVGDAAWQQAAGGPWLPLAAPTGTTVLPPTLDEAVVETALAPALRTPAEDVGIEVVDGAPARHCRTETTGALALAGFPELEWLAETSAAGGRPDLGAWRGQLDWWVFLDGQLGMAQVSISGISPADWPGGGVQGVLQETLTATDRTTPLAITPPPGL